MRGIAIDPGKHGLGVAIYVNGKLNSAYYEASLDRGLGLLNVVAAFAQSTKLCDVALIERPQVYDTKHQKGDQADIADLSLIVGAIGWELQAYAEQVKFVLPAEWKGQVPKDVHWNRVKAKLTQEELETIQWKSKTLDHNIQDAVALGHWAVKKGLFK
jgi:hypothetical protein